MQQNSEEVRRNLRWLAVAMDNKWQGPLGIGIGWDGLIGLIPVFGDVVTTIVSVYIVLSASQLGVPMSVLSRMAINILLDNFVGGIPLLGWLFDFMYKSNLKNLALIDVYLEHPTRVASQSRWMIGGLIVGILALSTALIFAMGWLLFQVGAWLSHLNGWS